MVCLLAASMMKMANLLSVLEFLNKKANVIHGDLSINNIVINRVWDHGPNDSSTVKVPPHSKFQTSSNHHFITSNPQLHYMTHSPHHHVTPHITPHLTITISRAAQPSVTPGLVSSTATLSKHPFIPWEIPWGFPHDPNPSLIHLIPFYLYLNRSTIYYIISVTPL
jgi:hypothetical protein